MPHKSTLLFHSTSVLALVLTRQKNTEDFVLYHVTAACLYTHRGRKCFELDDLTFIQPLEVQTCTGKALRRTPEERERRKVEMSILLTALKILY